MNLIKELLPYNKTLDIWKAGHGCSDQKALKAFIDIWNRFAPTRLKEIYGSSAHKFVPIEPNCSSCMSDVLSFLYNWRIIELRNPENGHYHKMIPPKKGVKVITPGKWGLTSNWKEMRAEAKKRGIKTHRVKKLELANLLNKQIET